MFDKKTDSKAASDAVPQSESGTTTPDLVADEKAPVKQDADPDVTEEAEIDKEDAAGTAEEEYQTGLPLALVMVSVLLTVCLTSLDMTIVGTAIPKITDEFHGLNMVSWVSFSSRNLFLPLIISLDFHKAILANNRS